MIKGILFDLDGTLTDTFGLWYEPVREIVLKYTGNTLGVEEYRRRY